VFGGLSGIL